MRVVREVARRPVELETSLPCASRSELLATLSLIGIEAAAALEPGRFVPCDRSV